MPLTQKSIAVRFTRAFTKGILDQFADKVADICFLLGPLVILLGRNGFSVKRIMAGQWESITTVVIGLSGLVIWHGARSAFAVALEVKQEGLAHGFRTPPAPIRFARTKLAVIVLALAGTMLGLSYLAWSRIPKAAPASSEADKSPKAPTIPTKSEPSKPKHPRAPGSSEGFSVDIEHRIFTTPGAVTGFWFGSFGPSACSVEPVGTAIFLRITNLQPRKEMITAYVMKGLLRVPVTHGRMFVILPKGKVTNGFVPRALDWGAPAGMGAMVDFRPDDADTSKSIPITGDFLDFKVGEGHYLETDESVRGWVFFEYRRGYIEIPAHLTIEITDQFQRTFSYLVPDHVGNPEGDVLPRRIVEWPLEDLSGCKTFN